MIYNGYFYSGRKQFLGTVVYKQQVSSKLMFSLVYKHLAKILLDSVNKENKWSN